MGYGKGENTRKFVVVIPLKKGTMILTKACVCVCVCLSSRLW